MFISPIDTSALDAGASTTSTKANSGTDPQAAQDRFLKLLVAQLNNQDPMNPLDNAQMTSQMAQINTVTGIQQLNLSMQGMAEQFAAMQSLQGTMMIGRAVLTEGNRLAVSDKGQAQGAFELTGAASAVKVEISTAGGDPLATLDMGAQAAGRHSIEWDASGYKGDASTLRFKVVATNKDGAGVDSTALMQAKVQGTSTQGGQLMLTLNTGESVAYSKIRSVV